MVIVISILMATLTTFIIAALIAILVNVLTAFPSAILRWFFLKWYLLSIKWPRNPVLVYARLNEGQETMTLVPELHASITA